MDDFVLPTLKDSRFEWASRLINVLSPHIIDGIVSIFEDSVKICKENNEMEKYLMTFQNFISRVPKWNEFIIETETKRIIEKSQCKYLEDLITCVHIIQLKILSAIRVGSKQKKIEINVPKINDFLHKVYVYAGRKVYKNAYLFELHIPPLQKQKNMALLEKIVHESILNTVRDSIPVEALLKAYMSESVEDEVTEEIKEVVVESTPQTQPPPPPQSQLSNELLFTDNQPKESGIKLNDVVADDVPLTIPKLEPYSDQSVNTDIVKAANTVSFNDNTFLRDEKNVETVERQQEHRGPVIGEEISLNFDVIDLNESKKSDTISLKDQPMLLNDVEILN